MASEFVIYLIGINVVTFLIYGIDKWKARRERWRIPEDTLIWLAIPERYHKRNRCRFGLAKERPAVSFFRLTANALFRL